MCGYEYVAKLQRMYKDKENSKTINDDFKKRLATSDRKLPHDFDVMVMSTNAWPFNQAPTFSVPADMATCQQRFTEFYTDKFNGRKLNFNYMMSKGEVNVHGLDKTYTIIATTAQMAVLMQVGSCWLLTDWGCS